MSLAQRYLLAALLSLAVFIGVSGLWLDYRIGHESGQSSANSAISLVRAVLEPLAQAVPAGGTLDPNAIDGLLAAPAIADHVAGMRVWRPDGHLIYASDRNSPSGGALPVPDLDKSPLKQERDGGKLFEISMPLFKPGTREVIAIATVYTVGETSVVESGWARTQGVVVLGLLALVLLAVPFRMVQNASRQIERQVREIAGGKTEVAQLSSRNEALGNLAKVVQQRGLEHNERMLRRIGSDLHDGPAQHLALVLLRLDELAPLIDNPGEGDPNSSRVALETIRRATTDALKEIRQISGGVALPELQKISLTDALGIAVRSHQRATGTRVETMIGSLPARLPLPMTICLYRFAQEALNNAFRHAGGQGQRLGASYDGRTILVEVADSGPGFAAERVATGDERLGLSGLRYRVESLGGMLQINSTSGHGAKLSVQFRNPLA